jgi:3-oxoacyl-[acyl-carrier protein] reductase
MNVKFPDPLSFDFRVTQSMIESFARLTGDYNSMHMDPEVARRSRFRRTIVHGMLPFSFLSLVQSQHRDNTVSFTELSAHFNKPFFADDDISLNISRKEKDGNVISIHAEWYRKGTHELLLVARGLYEPVPMETRNSIHTPDRTSFLTGPVEENRYTIDELDDQTETLNFELCSDVLDQYNREIFSSVSPPVTGPAFRSTNLAASLLLSTMVGMRLPGRYATFARFKVTFHRSIKLNHTYVMEAGLSRVSREADHINATLSVSDNGKVVASGKYEVSLNSPPKPMPACHEIRQYHMDFGLSGKVALITGASRGIGETTAKLLAMHGVKCAVTYLHGKSDAERIITDIKSAGGEAFAIQCNITLDDQVNSVVSEVIDNYKRIDILVNNAVKEFTQKYTQDLTWGDYLDELEVSVKGMHACCRAVIPHLLNAGGGKIINLSTVAVAIPIAGQSRYITAKSAVEGYTKTLAVELARNNIQVNLVVPNMTDTDLISSIPSLYRERIADTRSYQRHVQPIEVAQSIVYLASKWSDAMTGQNIVLNLGEPPFA